MIALPRATCYKAVPLAAFKLNLRTDHALPRTQAAEAAQGAAPWAASTAVASSAVSFFPRPRPGHFKRGAAAQ
eukprot:12001461-Alexandrium_andersonii.AAC.1